MESELVGMSNEELMLWACNYGAIDRKQLRKIFPDIELWCAQSTMAVWNCVALLVKMSNEGITLAIAFKALKETECR